MMKHTTPDLVIDRAAPPAPPAKAGQDQHQSLRDAAYKAIKHRIITLGFQPGEFINAAVCVALGIGRTPVHQAFDRLMLEGMVDVIPRKGIIVKPVSFDEIVHIVEVRLITETYCVRTATERASEDDLTQLSDIVQQARQWLGVRNIEHLMILDRDFHGVLARCSGNRVLSDTLANLHDRSLRFWFLSLASAGQHENVQIQHEAILAAMRDRDARGAEEAMRAHIDSFKRNLTQNM
jgi:GntR family transcriptional regulator, rspAB operon transcriptional repressor